MSEMEEELEEVEEKADYDRRTQSLRDALDDAIGRWRKQQGDLPRWELRLLVRACLRYTAHLHILSQLEEGRAPLALMDFDDPGGERDQAILKREEEKLYRRLVEVLDQLQWFREA